MKRLLASCFGLGRLPVAPGTFGSLPPVAVFALLRFFDGPAALSAAAMAVLALAGSVICVICSPAVIKAAGSQDPREVGADEFAGQSVTFIIVSAVAVGALNGSRTFLPAGGGFLLFRLFDIVKPWPIRKLEKLPGGWGILADDLLAGVYAGIALLVFLRLWMYYFRAV